MSDELSDLIWAAATLPTQAECVQRLMRMGGEVEDIDQALIEIVGAAECALNGLGVHD